MPTIHKMCQPNSQSAYLTEFAALNGFTRREFFRLALCLRLNDIRLRNWRKSKLRIVSMVDCLKNVAFKRIIAEHVKRSEFFCSSPLFLKKSIICEKLFDMMANKSWKLHTVGCCWRAAWSMVMKRFE